MRLHNGIDIFIHIITTSFYS